MEGGVDRFQLIEKKSALKATESYRSQAGNNKKKRKKGGLPLKDHKRQ